MSAAVIAMSLTHCSHYMRIFRNVSASMTSSLYRYDCGKVKLMLLVVKTTTVVLCYCISYCVCECSRVPLSEVNVTSVTLQGFCCFVPSVR